jgi:perosamine synthetase
MNHIPIAKVEIAEEDIAAVVTVLRSGQLIQGARVAEFERQFARQVGAQYAIAASSGTAALHVAYLSVLKPGDEVIVPAFTHISTASMVVFAGGKPVFCDVDPRTFNLDIADARKRITRRTAAIAPVHLYGNACDIAGISELARTHGLKIIWDAAQAHGTRYQGEDIGSFGDLVCYSFYPTKNMTTGEGGMITTNDPALAEKCRYLCSHWQTQKYFHPGLGLNYRMTDMAGAIGLGQLKRLDNSIQRRRYNAAYLTEHLKKIDGILTPIAHEGVEHSYHQYTIVVEPDKLAINRDILARELQIRGIGTSIHYPNPVHRQPAFEGIADKVVLSVAEQLSRTVLSLPVHPALSQPDLAAIVHAMQEVLADEDGKR